MGPGHQVNVRWDPHHERINARGALIKVLDKPHLDLTTPLGRGFIAFFSAMAEDGRGRILQARQRRPQGRQGQRCPVRPQIQVHNHQQAEALKRLDAGETFRSVAKSMNVAER
jgi:hypothetical protein